jgi:hypothetical protein
MPKTKDKGEQKNKKKAQKNLKEKRAAKKMKGTGGKTYSTMSE